MAKLRSPRTISMSNKVFDDLNMLVIFRKLKGENATIGGIIEGLVVDYLAAHEAELNEAWALRRNWIGELTDDRN